MADALTSKKKRGRPSVSESERKRRKLFRNKDHQQTRVFLGSEKVRWDKIKDEKGLKTDREVATFLIDSFKHTQDAAVPGTSKQVQRKESELYFATPARAVSTPSVSSISEPESEREAKMSGVEDIHSSDEKTSEIEVASQLESRPKATKQLPSSFVDPFEISIDVTMLDSEEDDDPDYEPSVLISTALPDYININSDDVAFEEAEYGLERVEEENEDEKDESSDDGDSEGVTYVRNDEHCKSVCNDLKCVAFLTQLKKLALMKTAMCQICNSRELELQERFVGSAVYFKWICKDGHLVERWCSQPVLNRQLHSGDFLICSTILSGNNYSKMDLWASMLHLKFPSADQFHKIQTLTTYLVPTVDEFLEDHCRDLIAEFQHSEVIVLGDGRNDSPGHCAQYCSYTLMEMETKKILSLKTVDKRATELKSAAMEKTGFKAAMEDLASNGATVKEVVTDGHTGIAALMKSSYAGIKHSQDIWHVAKNLGKKINKVAQKKGNSILHQWNRDIINHFWFTCKKAENYAQFVGIWGIVLHHIVNEHEWILSHSDDGVNHCLHEPIDENDRSKPWLHPKTNAHTLKDLACVVFDKRLLGNVGYYLNFRSTADLEGFNQHILMYAAKRFSYTPPVYRVRNLLAATDHNKHADQPNCLNKDGSQRLQRVWNKKSGRWSVYPVRVKKTYKYMDSLLTSALIRRVNDKVGMYKRKPLEADDPRKLSKHLAPVSPKPTKDIYDHQKSRFK